MGNSMPFAFSWGEGRKYENKKTLKWLIDFTLGIDTCMNCRVKLRVRNNYCLECLKKSI